MSMNQQIRESAASDLRNAWGGRWPTWDEFKSASENGRVQVNKTIAAEAVRLPPVPAIYRILYGVITLWIGFLALPVTAIAWFFSDFSAWWIAGALAGGMFLISVSRNGHCEGTKAGAEQNEEFYQWLVENGAFLFGPVP